MITEIVAEKRTWRERRGEGWSETLYSGLFFPGVGGHGLLVARLSHGLRAFSAKSPDEYKVESTGPVNLSEEELGAFWAEVLVVHQADRQFQTQSPVFERAMEEEEQ